MGDEREAQIQKMHELAAELLDFRDAGGDANVLARRILGIPDPPPTAPEEKKEPEVNVPDELAEKISESYGGSGYRVQWGWAHMQQALRAAFPILLRDNPAWVEKEILRRIEAKRNGDYLWLNHAGCSTVPVRSISTGVVGAETQVGVRISALLSALGVAAIP